jgi:hypothetical protein
MTTFKMVRLDVLLPAWLKTNLQALALAKCVTPSEYIRDVLKAHVESTLAKAGK